jgi:hypothetical protein
MGKHKHQSTRTTLTGIFGTHQTYILNKGNEPIFVIHSSADVTDLTFQTNKRGNLESNWHVSGEISLSDHRYILFQVGDL